MIILNKYIINFLINAILFVHTMSRPLEYARSSRQVVQPTWLSLKDNLLPIDGKVHVTKDRLDEVAQLRQSIQEAVDNGEYAIESPQTNSSHLLPFPADETTSTTPVPILNSFDIFRTDFFQQTPTTTWTDFVSEMQRKFSLFFTPSLPFTLPNNN